MIFSVECEVWKESSPAIASHEDRTVVKSVMDIDRTVPYRHTNVPMYVRIRTLLKVLTISIMKSHDKSMFVWYDSVHNKVHILINTSQVIEHSAFYLTSRSLKSGQPRVVTTEHSELPTNYT